MKLFDLYDYLKAAKFCRPEQLMAELEQGAPEPSFSTSGGGLLLFRHRYSGRIGIEKAVGDFTHVLALCHVWLAENGGDDLHNKFTGWVGEPADDRLSDIDLRFEFEEEIFYDLAPGYTGKDKITWKGQVYKRQDPAPDSADEVLGVTTEVG